MGCGSHYEADAITAWYIFSFIDKHTSMFGTLFHFHIRQNCLFVLGRIEYLIHRIDIHSPVTLPKQSRPLKNNQQCVLQCAAYPSLESLRLNIWIISVELTSWPRTSPSSIQLSS